MRFWNFIKNALTPKPRDVNGFLAKFIKDSKKSRVQFEIIRNNEILIQVDSLKFTPSWFKVFNVNEKEFENGFVIFFILDLKDIESNEKYKLYRKSELQLLERNEMLEKTQIITFAKFIGKTEDPIYLGNEIKKIIDGIVVSNEIDSQALFNLRYIDESKIP